MNSANAEPSASVEEPKRTRMKSAGVAAPCRCVTDHSRGMIRNTSGYTMIVYGTAKNPSCPTPYNGNGGEQRNEDPELEADYVVTAARRCDGHQFTPPRSLR